VPTPAGCTKSSDLTLAADYNITAQLVAIDGSAGPAAIDQRLYLRRLKGGHGHHGIARLLIGLRQCCLPLSIGSCHLRLLHLGSCVLLIGHTVRSGSAARSGTGCRLASMVVTRWAITSILFLCALQVHEFQAFLASLGSRSGLGLTAYAVTITIQFVDVDANDIHGALNIGVPSRMIT